MRTMTKAEWYANLALTIREDHLAHCDGASCNVSLYGILKMAIEAGASFTDEQRNLFGTVHPIIKNVSHLGEQGTEQFEIAVRDDKKIITRLAVHDPFHRTHIGVRLSRWRAFCGLFRPAIANYWISMSGSAGAERAIMTMDPHRLADDSEQILLERKVQREANDAAGVKGFYADVK